MIREELQTQLGKKKKREKMAIYANSHTQW